MTKYVKLYVSESQDRLQRMDGLLLSLEQNGGDRAAIDTLFREAHSIKGMSASMGYDELARISHRMEDFLEQVRGGKGALDARSVDLLFEGVDLLRRGVDEVAAAGTPSLNADAYVSKITPLIQSGPAPEAAAAAPAPPPPPERPALRIELRIAADAPLPSARAYLTLRRARDVGEVLDSSPTLAEVQAGQFTGELRIRLATDRPAGEVQAFLASLPDVASVAVRAETGGEPGPAAAPVQPPAAAPAVIAPAPPPPAAAAPAGPPAARPARTMMRVDTRLLDELMDQVGELVTANGALGDASQALESPRLHETADRLGGLIKGLQHHAMQLRLMPLEFIADRFPRAVRDLAQRQGKEVAFEVVGKETELDRAILDALVDPILHILRNAVDHGVEPIEERLRQQKPRAGTIRLQAGKERESIVIRISDDGRGMDPNELRRVAVERGVMTREQAAQLSDAEARLLVALPGFSTAKTLSDVSGRGVGMDVVRGTMEALRGTLVIDSEIGRGTTVTLKLPLTLLVAPVLLIALADERYAIPVSMVEQVIEVGRDEVQRTQGQEMIACEGALIPLLQLRQLLGLPPAAGTCPVILSEMRGRRVGLAVDRLVGYREVVVKPLDKALKGVRGFSGVTILGDGSAVLLLDVNTL